MWPGLVQLAKEGGVDVIETYVFWNGHELSPDNVIQIQLKIDGLSKSEVILRGDRTDIYSFLQENFSITLEEGMI